VAKIIKAEILFTRMKQNVFPDKDDWSLSFWLSGITVNPLAFPCKKAN